MPQSAMKNAFTIFPDFAALVPFDEIAGDTPSITNFSEITKSNSFVINDTDSDEDLVLSEGGIAITKTKSGEEILGFDEGGQGPIDDVTTSRTMTAVINVNGWSHYIWAILMGLNPKSDIKEDFKFLKDDTTGVFAAGVDAKTAIRKQKFFFIARVPLSEGGFLYYCAPYTVVQDQEYNIPITPTKVTTEIPLKGLKLLDSGALSTLQSFSDAITNGYEMLFAWNEAGTAYSV